MSAIIWHTLSPGNAAERTGVRDPLQGTRDLLTRGPRSRGSDRTEVLRRSGLQTLPPEREAGVSPAQQVRCPIFGQLCFCVKTIFLPCMGRLETRHARARNLWYMRHRLLPWLLMHPLCILFHPSEGYDPLQLAVATTAQSTCTQGIHILDNMNVDDSLSRKSNRTLPNSSLWLLAFTKSLF